ncbi:MULTISPECIES: phytanoyl-CoA dioxygenase family protein [unclassified Devosia]|jgi:phytanoyl-CoA hydroxylase|uniref:phytanoyl-CoA dioxygenase family protein n=1 Tax=unclassified Devosia TaxID=196773 RepID=UPI0023D898A5|nr:MULTISPECIES: phytanoyl-CoA dioxygenase family protein [unclassified Devosia]WEJ34558.1 phytanoyl-CoA dioxygenase family protein [Devosia sp. SD17-2]
MSQAMQTPLTSLKEDFDRDGFIAIKPLFDAAKMAEINREFDRYVEACVPQMKDTEVFYEEKGAKGSLKQMQNMQHYDDYFRSLLETDVVRELAETMLGERARAVNLEYFNKPAGIGKPTPPHQDGYYFHFNPPAAVTGWLALERVDEENGCIHYVRGSHKIEGYRPHGRSQILGFSQGITDFGTEDDKANTAAFPGEAGTFLMHHSKTIHWAGPNTSPTRARRALGFVYFGESAKVDEEARAAYQAKLQAEMRAANQI